MTFTARVVFAVFITLISINCYAKDKLKVGFVSFTGDVTTYIAYKKGFFLEQDLDVELVHNKAGIDSLRQLVNGHELSVSTSIGIALSPAHGNTVDTLMRNVDAALYEAKNMGKATFAFYTKELTVNAERLLKIEREIEQGISKNEFEMFYQPQVDATNDRVVGLEALIRWNHPARGLLPPPEFIPVAEKTMLIRKLGMWIIDNVFQQVAEWQTRCQTMPKVSINISSYQFDQEDLIEQISALINRYKIDTKNVCFEITESTFLNHTKKTLNSIEQLRQLGFEFAIDDFGTGYSCLSYLNRLPIDIIKIDKEFVDSINGDGLNTSPLESIIILAAGLGLKLVAEGVEDKTQVAFLVQRKCYVIQGYYYSKPMPAEMIQCTSTEVVLNSPPPEVRYSQ